MSTATIVIATVIGLTTYWLGLIIGLIVGHNARSIFRAERDMYRELAEQHLALAETDVLTELPNRRRAEQNFAAYRDRGEPVDMIMFDVDGFKEINDKHGHRAGDQFLIELSRRLRAAARDAGGEAHRLGGDELLCLIPAVAGDYQWDVAEALRTAAAAEPIWVNGRLGEADIRPSLSVGVYELLPLSDVAFSEALHRADCAMYVAKNSGGDRTIRWLPAYADIKTVAHLEGVRLRDRRQHRRENPAV